MPRDMNANIHKGEQIIPKPIADSIRSGQATLGGGGASQQPIIVQVDGQTLFEINEKRRTDQANMMGASNYSQRSIYA